MTFREFINEQKDLTTDYLDKVMKSDDTLEDSKWDRVYKFNDKKVYDKMSRKMVSLVATFAVWKTDYDKKELLIKVILDKKVGGTANYAPTSGV